MKKTYEKKMFQSTTGARTGIMTHVALNEVGIFIHADTDEEDI